MFTRFLENKAKCLYMGPINYQRCIKIHKIKVLAFTLWYEWYIIYATNIMCPIIE
jgi:hypothetical protein